MSATVIGVGIGKGGAGKSTFAHVIGSELYFMREKKVLFVDFDNQGTLSYMLGLTPELVEAYSDRNFPEEIMKGKISTLYNIEDNVSIIPSSNLFASYLMQSNENKELFLSRLIEPFLEEYDYIVIDTPPSGLVFVDNIINASNILALPFIFGHSEVDANAKYLIELGESFERFSHKVSKMVLFSTRYKAVAKVHKEVLQNYASISKELNQIDCYKSIDIKYFSKPFRERTLYQNAVANFMPLQEILLALDTEEELLKDISDLVDVLVGEE